MPVYLESVDYWKESPDSNEASNNITKIEIKIYWNPFALVVASDNFQKF